MKYFTMSNASRVGSMMERCKAVMDMVIKAGVDMDSIKYLDADTLDLLKEVMCMFDEACDLTVDMAKQLDEQTEMLVDMTNQMENMEKQNEEILKLLKKEKNKE